VNSLDSPNSLGEPHADDKHDFGNVTFKELPRPSIAHFYFELCPLIDNHNKDRQGILGLEDCWPTKNPWFRLVTTLIGMSVNECNMHRWDRNQRSGGKAFDWMNADDEKPDFLQVRTMANLIAKGLHLEPMQYYDKNTKRPTIPIRNRQPQQQQELRRITDKAGNIRRPDGNRKEYQQTCFICRQYQKKQQNTQWCCARCKMPLCKKQRRDVSCFQEHCDHAGDSVLGCGAQRVHFVMPVEYRKRKDATSTETTIEPATPQHSRHITGNSVGYDSDMSFPSIGSSVLELEKRTTRSETAKQKMPAKKKTPQKIQRRHPIRSTLGRTGAGKKK
jgi:hypothetical protein